MRITISLALLFLPALLVGEAQDRRLSGQDGRYLPRSYSVSLAERQRTFDPEWQHCQAILAAEAQNQAARGRGGASRQGCR